MKTAVLCLAVLLAVGVNAGYDDVPSQMSWTGDMEVGSLDYSTSSSGLKYYDLPTGNEGTSPFRNGDSVTVLYKLYLRDDMRHIYSQAVASEAFTLRVNAGQVIKGFDEAVAGMHLNTRRVAILPSDLGYGNRGMGGFGIPPNADLVYFLEVIDAKQGRDL